MQQSSRESYSRRSLQIENGGEEAQLCLDVWSCCIVEAEATVRAEFNAMDGAISGATAKTSNVGAKAVIVMKAADMVSSVKDSMCGGHKDCMDLL